MSREVRRFKRYPAYRDSGIEWLGEVPDEWQVRRLKYVAGINLQSLPEDTDPGLEMQYVDIGGVNNLGEILAREGFLFEGAPSRARRLVQHGDVIVSTVRTYLRAIAPIKKVDADIVVSTGFAVVRPRGGLIPEYAAYALRAPFFVERVVAESKGVSFPAILECEMATFEIALPPAGEQQAIAAFLDRETARIDALVARKERLIELLQEKRGALITRAVTKGLRPNVPTKDPGVTGLGEIPSHWTVKPYKHTCARVFVGIAEAATFAYVDDGVPLLRSTDVRRDRIRTDDIRSIDPSFADKLRSKMLRTGDIVTVRTGNAGVSAAVPQEYDGGQCFTLVVSRPLPAHVSEFFSYSLNCNAVQAQFQVEGMGTAQVNISVPIVQNLQLAVPPPDEQKAIVKFIHSRTQELDALIGRTTDAISKLLELRSALISAAVTGKIDVREEVA